MLKEIQRSDHDRYISLIFAPKEKRDALLSITQFNLEIARIKNRVSEAMLGAIRLQWWREAMDEIFDPNKTPRKHEIVFALRAVVEEYPALNKADFIAIIDAREKDLDKNPFKTEWEFDDYLVNTTFPVNKIILDILGVQNAQIIEAVRHISYGWGITAILRSAPKNFSKGRVVLPLDMMEKYNLRTDLFGSEEFLNNSRPLVRQLVEQAMAELEKAAQILKPINKKDKKPAAPVLLVAELAKHYITQITKNKYDIFSRNIRPLSLSRLLKIYFKASTGNL